MKNLNKLNRLKLFNIHKFDGGGHLEMINDVQYYISDDPADPKKGLPLKYDSSNPDHLAALDAAIKDGVKNNTSLTETGLFAGLLFGVNATGHLKIDPMTGKTKGLSATGELALGSAAKLGTAALSAIDQATMGDKNFGAQSAAIDSAVHGASSALMSSGNPYAMAAGAALEVGNFATKATGQTIQGFDVDINSTGYGNLGHMESKSSRDFASLIGLGGLKDNSAKLAERNRQAQMAMKAANISDDIKFEQEARMNSVDNVIQANQQALAGGVDTSLLGS